MMKKQAGFTLIELAVVIAILAILAAVAIPRFANTTASAERAQINGMVAQLTSAYAMATAEQAAPPTTFAQFVTHTNAPTCGNGNNGPRSCTLNIQDFGTNGGCTVQGTTINCNGAFNSYTGAIRYTLANGVVTRTGGTPVNGAPPL